ncbi:MAG: hypothetical protein RMX65_005760 [Nostoc sp. DedQUE01]|nr:hypothetical protein [Nostoc sp. DedQUE01]
MEPSVADKTPIPAKVWRRHIDPPGLWISVAIGSVSLHLLVFWLLMRSSNTFSLWFPQESQSAIAIELINIAPATKSTSKSQSAVKTVSPKRLSSTQKSVAARTTSKKQDSAAINSADNLEPKRKSDTSQTNSQRFRQQKVSKSIPRPTATPRPKIPVGNLPWNRRQDLKFGKGTPLPTGIPPTPPKGTTPTPSPQTSPTPPKGTTPTPSPQTSPTSTQGASVAIVAPLLRDEVSNLIKSGKFIQDALPDAIAVYQGSNTKQFDSSFLPQNFELKPAQLLASLVIDRNGNFQQAVVLEIEPATLENEKSTYQQVLNQIFKTENFLPAQNNDGTKPDLSNLYVRIKIQSANSN